MSEHKPPSHDSATHDEHEHEHEYEQEGHVHGPDCQHDHHPHHHIETYRRETPKVGRNDPCYCGSGQKFKKCHGNA